MTTSVFVSHSKYDSDFALKLCHWLKDFQYIEDIWVDLRELKLGMEHNESTREGIKQSHIVIIIISNNSKDSKWVKHCLRNTGKL